MHKHIITILLAVSATLIALSLYVFRMPMLNTLDIIFRVIASCALILGAVTIVSIAIIAVFYPRKLTTGDIYSVFQPKDFVGLSPAQITAFFDGLLKLKRGEMDVEAIKKQQKPKQKEREEKSRKVK